MPIQSKTETKHRMLTEWQITALSLALEQAITTGAIERVSGELLLRLVEDADCIRATTIRVVAA